MPDVTFKAPPNYRAGGKCCGNCKRWEWAYEGEGECAKYPVHVETGADSFDIYESGHSVMVCDDWEDWAP